MSEEVKPYNQLNPSQVERLAYLVGELGEAVQAVANVLRHGYESKDPDCSSGATNRELLESELGDIENGIRLLYENGELDPKVVEARALYKRESCMQYMHHQAFAAM